MKKIFILTLMWSIFTSCGKQYKSVKDITHTEYLNLNTKPKEMKVSFFVDEINNGVYIPKEKVNLTEFNNSVKNLFLYPNLSYNTVNEDFVVDGKILKHLIISYLDNPVEVNYNFNDQGNVTNITTKGGTTGNLQIKISYDKNGNIIEYAEKDSRGMDSVIDTFNYDDNNLLIKKKKKVFDNGNEVGGSEIQYNYEFEDHKKIICTMSSGTKKTIFEVIKIDENITSFGNENYILKFKNIYLLSEEKYVGNTIKESWTNSYENNQLSKIVIKDYSYVEYTLNYLNNQVSSIIGKQDGIEDIYQIKMETDSKNNWNKMSITNEAAFNRYKKVEKEIIQLDSNKFFMDESIYNMRRKMAEVQIISLRFFLNQRRCERNIIY